jgi:tetratricopeptide (TPR) repeat protein
MAAPATAAARPGGLADGARDTRRTRTAQRAIALLVTEIQGLESLFAATGVTAADRPLILRRLAEDYVELAYAADRERAEAERKRDAERASNPREAGRLQSIIDMRRRTAVAARAAAIRDYGRLVEEYAGQASSTFPQSPPPAYAMIDEARYFEALTFEQAGDLANARRLYLDVISHAPNSKYAPLAYFAFGEFFLQESDADPTKLTLAKAAYEKVIASPPPEDQAFGWAWFRLGQVAEKQGDRPTALSAYRRAIDFAKTFSQMPGATGIEDAVPVWVAQAPADPWWNGAPDGPEGTPSGRQRLLPSK